MTSPLPSAIYFDRDGTLIENVPYNADPEKVAWRPGALDFVKKCLGKDIPLFLLTNQSGIGRGLYTWHDFERIQQRMLQIGDFPQSPFREICAACDDPSSPIPGPTYRKPSTLFIEQTLQYYQIDRSGVWFIGDSDVDYDTALAADIEPLVIISPGTSVTLSKHCPAEKLCSSWAEITAKFPL